MLFSSSSTVVSPPALSVKFRTSFPASPRSRLLHPPSLSPSPTPPLATAATSSTSTEDRKSKSTSTSSFPHPLQAQRMMASSLYEILGIPTGATGQEIKTAYRQLARTCHPDVLPYDCKDTSAGQFIKIHAAYCTLSDPEKRAVYDQKLFRRRRRPLTSTSGFSGYSGRSWETDQCW